MQVQCLTNLVDDSCKDSTLIMQLLRDNKLLRRHRQAYGLVDFPSKCVTQKARQSFIVNMYSLIVNMYAHICFNLTWQPASRLPTN